MEKRRQITGKTRGALAPSSKKPSQSKSSRDAQTQEFRIWLRDRIVRDRRSLHAIEIDADIRGNALGKFIRGERGAVHGLTPLMLRRLAPVLMIGEIELLARAGHLSDKPWSIPVLEAIATDPLLDDDEKVALIITYDRFARYHGASSADLLGSTAAEE